MDYVVEVQYREPTYELRSGPKASPYRWSFAVAAADEAQARAMALGRFEQMASLSSVGWIREVVGVTVSASPSRA